MSTRKRLDKAWHWLEQNQPRHAQEAATGVLAQSPDCTEAWHILGLGRYAAGDSVAALQALARAERLAPAQATAALNHARILRELGRPAEALARLEPALATGTGDRRLAIARAQTLCRLDRGDLAVPALEALIAKDRRNLELWLLLAECREQGANFAGAWVALEQALTLAPVNALVHRRRARILLHAGRLDEVAQELDLALQQCPGEAPSATAETQLALADLAALRGNFGDAERHAHTALKHNPLLYVAWLHVVPDRDRAPNAEVTRTLAQLCRQQAHDPYAWPVFLASGRALEAGGHPDAAFRLYTAANLRRSRLIPYDPEARRAYTEDIIEALDETFVNRPVGVQDTDGPQPIFIIGLPRSGTTLVESILATYAEVAAGGEMSFLHDWLRRRYDNAALQRTGSLLHAASARELTELASAWRRELARIGTGAHWVTDKLPDNFALVGLCHVCFPRAPIVLVTREPRDVAISCYTTPFMSGQTHSSRLEWLAHYHRLYQRLMDHWRQILPPGRIIELNYETLVEQPQATAQALCAGIGLAWDPACLDFHRQDRPIATASLRQVREPLNNRSIGRWRRFERHLGPLTTALTDTRDPLNRASNPPQGPLETHP